MDEIDIVIDQQIEILDGNNLGVMEIPFGIFSQLSTSLEAYLEHMSG